MDSEKVSQNEDLGASAPTFLTENISAMVAKASMI